MTQQTKISELTATTSTDPSDAIPMVSGSTTKRIRRDSFLWVEQADYAGASGNYTVPTGTVVLRMWLCGPGGGGGAGNASAYGGGGGSGCEMYAMFQGTLGGKVLAYVLPTGGVGGTQPGGDGGIASGHGTVTFDNGWSWVAGQGSAGAGASGTLPGTGGAGGPAAISGSQPSYVVTYGQFNLGTFFGQTADTRLPGYGGNRGNSGCGGDGGLLLTNGTDASAAYVHFEASNY